MSNRQISIYDAHTGFVFTSGSPRYESWGWIKEIVAAHYEVDADDLRNIEDDDGNEFVACKGEVLAGIHTGRHTIKFGQVYRAPLAQAAE